MEEQQNYPGQAADPMQQQQQNYPGQAADPMQQQQQNYPGQAADPMQQQQQNYPGQANAPQPMQPQQNYPGQANAPQPMQPQQNYPGQANAPQPMQQVPGEQPPQPMQPKQNSRDLKFSTDRPMKPKELAGKDILFPTSVYDKAERSKLLFTSDLTHSKDLGTAEIRYTKPRGEDQPFLIIKFENEKNAIGLMMGDIKEAKKAWSSSPDPMFAIKGNNDKILGYKLNPSAKFAWDREKRELLVI